MKPSEEKRYLNHYKDKSKNKQAKDMKIVDYMKEPNQSHLDDIAVSYYGNEITFGEFFALIDKAHKTYRAMGIEKGDYVPLSSPNFIDGLASFYALNQIGAIPNMISPLATSEEFEHHLKEAPVKNVIIFDKNLSSYREVLKKGDIKNTILVSPNTYLPKKLKVAKTIVDTLKGNKKEAKMSRMLTSESNPIYFDKALAQYSKEFSGDVESSSYNFDDTALLLHTGGTTGFPKAVEVINNNFNSMVHQYEVTIDSIERGDTMVTVLPMNIGFGLCNNMHMPLRMGMKLVLHPKFNPTEVFELFEKHKPNHFMATSTFFEYMMNDSRFDGMDLSFIKTLSFGGAGWSEEKKEQFNKWLEEHNAKRVIIAEGYGANEGVSSFLYEQNIGNGKHKMIPLVNTNQKIVNVNILPDDTIQRTDEELERGEIGEVCISGPTLTKGYKDHKEETDEVFRIHSDGIRWLHTGDLGQLDEDDSISVKGRIKRIYLTIDEGNAPAKFFPDKIEANILRSKYIKEVCVVGVPDDKKTNVPIAFIVLKDDVSITSGIKNEILSSCDNLSFYSRPVDYHFIDNLPKTNIGKNDFVLLTEEAINIRKNESSNARQRVRK